MCLVCRPIPRGRKVTVQDAVDLQAATELGSGTKERDDEVHSAAPGKEGASSRPSLTQAEAQAPDSVGEAAGQPVEVHDAATPSKRAAASRSRSSETSSSQSNRTSTSSTSGATSTSRSFSRLGGKAELAPEDSTYKSTEKPTEEAAEGRRDTSPGTERATEDGTEEATAKPVEVAEQAEPKQLKPSSRSSVLDTHLHQEPARSQESQHESQHDQHGTVGTVGTVGGPWELSEKEQEVAKGTRDQVDQGSPEPDLKPGGAPHVQSGSRVDEQKKVILLEASNDSSDVAEGSRMSGVQDQQDAGSIQTSSIVWWPDEVISADPQQPLDVHSHLPVEQPDATPEASEASPVFQAIPSQHRQHGPCQEHSETEHVEPSRQRESQESQESQEEAREVEARSKATAESTLPELAPVTPAADSVHDGVGHCASQNAVICSGCNKVPWRLGPIQVRVGLTSFLSDSSGTGPRPHRPRRLGHRLSRCCRRC